MGGLTLVFVHCGCFHIRALVILMEESLGVSLRSPDLCGSLWFAGKEKKCPHGRKQPRVSRPLCSSGKGLVLSEEDVYFYIS